MKLMLVIMIDYASASTILQSEGIDEPVSSYYEKIILQQFYTGKALKNLSGFIVIDHASAILQNVRIDESDCKRLCRID